MSEIERLRAFARSYLATARSMSLAVDAARLRQMAAEALAKAAGLETGLQHQGQQQQQPQPASLQKEEEEPKPPDR